MIYDPGLFGDLEAGKADMGWANLFASEPRRKRIDFTDSYKMDHFCALTFSPQAEDYGLSVLTQPFDLLSWTLLAVSGLAASIFVAILIKACPFVSGTPVTYVAAIILNQSNLKTSSIKSISLR